MADWCDDEGLADERDQLFELIRMTPHLDWLLLTKRADSIEKYLPDDWGNGYPNVWLGVTVEDRKHGLPRIDVLRKIPAVVRFLSIEPLLEDLGEIDLTEIHWVIIGGESGPGARPFDIQWAKSIIDQCSQFGAAPWMKQLGAKPVESGMQIKIIGQNGRLSGHADKPNEWLDHLGHLNMRYLPCLNLIS